MASPASRRSTPSRGTPNGIRRVNGFHASPSQQAAEDLGKVYASDQNKRKRALDDEESLQQRKQLRALDESLERHTRIREGAQRELQLVKLERERQEREQAELKERQIEDARRRLEQQKEDEKRRQIEAERAREEDARKREAARLREQEEAQQRAEAQAQREQAERIKKEQEQREERDRKAREEAETKRREQQAQKEREAAAQQAAPSGAHANGIDAGAAPAGIVSTLPEMEATHQQYLNLHKRLKTMRSQVLESVKALGQNQKAQLTEWRQGIQKTIGQLRKGDDEATKKANIEKLNAVQAILDAAARTTQPMINITEYIVEDQQPADAPKEGPAQLLFLLNHLAKIVVRQCITEAAVDPQIGNALGLLAVKVFARPAYLFNGQSLIDVLWAKYHKRCPALFGIYGDEMTGKGRSRIGWERNGEPLSSDVYYSGIRGLSIGFATVTLRDFSKATMKNPAPNTIFWQAMARILNTPLNDIQPTHYEIVKAVVENASQEMHRIYGGAAIALMKQAVQVFSRKHEQSGSKNPALKSKATALQALPEILHHRHGLSL